ncbi:MAG: hypothetical protein V4563_17315 [Pseudomonadota bacterium]
MITFLFRILNIAAMVCVFVVFTAADVTVGTFVHAFVRLYDNCVAYATVIHATISRS